MPHVCVNSWCKAPFEITKSDQEIYDSVSPEISGKKFPIPPPTLCPECRVQRRIASINVRNLYTRSCDATGKKLISIFSPEKKVPVYDVPYWWSDQWDPFRYGRDIDFSRSCDATGKKLISIFSPEKKVPVYDVPYWWSDQWDPFRYGRDIDFSRSF